MTAEELIRAGRPLEALESLQEAVRADPSSSKLRVFLFQLLALKGDWNRAMTQLNVLRDLDPDAILMAQVCAPALQAEALRTAIFAGKRAPVVFGEPESWMGWLVEANALHARGEHAKAADLRGQALEAAPATSGAMDGEAFNWIADADTRLGPMLEAVVGGTYYWIPFMRIAAIVLSEPEDLRDLVWAPAQFVWANGGQSVGLIPARYAGTESSTDGSLLLARKTEWDEQPGDCFVGLGQRILATDADEKPILQCREIRLDVVEPDDSESGDGG